MRKYSSIRNFKKFKRVYPYFVLFIKDGNYYYTYDADAKIMNYIFKGNMIKNEYKILKSDFKFVLEKLHDHGLNVVLAGWKNSREYYSEKMNNYVKIKKKSKDYVKNETKQDNFA